MWLMRASRWILFNLDNKSANYDPKTRSMREDPLPGANPNHLSREIFLRDSVVKFWKLIS